MPVHCETKSAKDFERHGRVLVRGRMTMSQTLHAEDDGFPALIDNQSVRVMRNIVIDGHWPKLRNRSNIEVAAMSRGRCSGKTPGSVHLRTHGKVIMVSIGHIGHVGHGLRKGTYITGRPRR